MKTLLRRFTRESSGATSIEYAFIAMLVSVAVVAGALAIGAVLDGIFAAAQDGLSG